MKKIIVFFLIFNILIYCTQLHGGNASFLAPAGVGEIGNDELIIDDNMFHDWLQVVFNIINFYGEDAIVRRDGIELSADRVNVVLICDSIDTNQSDLAILKASESHADIRFIHTLRNNEKFYRESYLVYSKQDGREYPSHVLRGLIYENGKFVLGSFSIPQEIHIAIMPDDIVEEMDEQKSLPPTLWCPLSLKQEEIVNKKNIQKQVVGKIIRVPEAYPTPNTKRDFKNLVEKKKCVVVKPVWGAGGQLVYLADISDAKSIESSWKAAQFIKVYKPDYLMVEEHIQSYPLKIKRKLRELSVRVIVTRNPDKSLNEEPEISFHCARIRKEWSLRGGFFRRWTLEETFQYLNITERLDDFRQELFNKAVQIFKSYEEYIKYPINALSVDFFITPDIEIVFNELSTKFGGWYEILKDKKRFGGKLLNPYIFRRFYLQGEKNRAMLHKVKPAYQKNLSGNRCTQEAL